MDPTGGSMKLVLLVTLFLSAFPVFASDDEAISISRRIQNYHMPHDVVSELRFVSPNSDQVLEIVDGDGAIWTGHYLAAEAFRYAVTRSEESYWHAVRALLAVEALSEISGTGLLARTMFPPDSKVVKWREQDASWKKVVYKGREMYYDSYVTRDQYEGVFFGVAAAYDLIDNQDVKNICRAIVTRLTDYLIAKNWILYNPDASRPVETFVGRFDQMLSILQIAKHINPDRFAAKYESTRKWWGWAVSIPVSLEAKEVASSYYKFNLDYGYFYNLIRLEGNEKIRAEYLKAYAPLKNATKTHLNAHFNMLDHVLTGAEGGRDQITRESLAALLQKGFRDYAVDLRGKYKECAPNLACQVIPVAERPHTDFLWQREPFLLYGGGDGSLQSPGVDYILPYWMARYYGVL